MKDEDYFYTKVVGVTFEGRQEYLADLQEGEALEIRREPTNIYDHNAIGIWDQKGRHLGYLNRKMSAHLAPLIDKGLEYNCSVSAVTGRDKETLGLNIYLERKDYVEEQEILEGLKERQRLEKLSSEQLLDEIRRFLLGKYQYRPKQKEALDRLFARKNTLTVMGTGRGKSAIFQSFAVYQAIRNRQITVITYPLRALVNDQYEALKQKLAPIGMRVFKANGSLSEWEREKFRKALASGEVDLILTTPEFLEFHIEKFKALRERIGFFVADEAHHIGMDSNAFRPAYQKLGWVLKELGDPLVLAVTATATNEVADVIMDTLGITDVVIDPHVRKNLRIRDLRNQYKAPKKNEVLPPETCKEDYIARLIRSGEKTIVYVNSREKTIEIAQKLCEMVPELEDQIVFYNAGLTSKERATVEDLFRTGEVRVVVSTSAFGEGIDIPDIRHVVLYHMNFNFVEFNQQSGRAGRDGNKAIIHLLFGWDDRRLNEFILDISTPDREYLVTLYCFLKKVGKCNLTNEEISETLKTKNEKILTSAGRVSAALGILEELNLVEIVRDGRDRTIQLLPTEPGYKIDLNRSARYSEGILEKKAFEEFSFAVMNEKNYELLDRINRPIYPDKYIEDHAQAV
ncbi:helicase-related protein [Anoxybacter fermentans]|uniref:helicase-related protein n=1 Tax=Anoxybacter fermentans TaxID=1323375 RepID=UPI0013DEAD97|nr:helicase-related protein [Anoxybacter fermentans]